MDVDKLFKLPKLPQSSVNKRKWREPDAGALKAARVEDDTETEPGPNGSLQGPTAGPSRPLGHFVQDFDDDEERVFDDQDEEDEDGRFFGGGLTDQQSRILELMDRAGEAETAADGSTSGEADLRALRRSLLRLERTINRNQEMRIRHADDPTRFLESEADLHEVLRSLVVCTTNSALFYPELMKQNTAASLCGLLTHENVDIVAGVVELLEEMTDDDVLDAGLEGRTEEEREADDAQRKGQAAVEGWLDALLERDLVALLVQTLPRLETTSTDTDNERERMQTARQANDESDASTLFHLLGLFENLVSLRASLADDLFAGRLPTWLLAQLRPDRPYDQNKGYAGELLCILLQAGTPGQISQRSRLLVDKHDGLDSLLLALSPVRKGLPDGAEERELVENLFAALCILLTVPANRATFYTVEGPELMCQLARSDRRVVRMQALKVLNHAISSHHGNANCEALVQANGLTALFAVLGDPRGRIEDEDVALEMLAHLSTNLASESRERLRLLAGFVRDGYAKLDRLVELHVTASQRLATTNTRIEDERRQYGPDDTADPEELEEWQTEALLERLQGGLFTLQQVDYLLAWLIMEDDGMAQHVQLLFQRQGRSLKEVVETLQGYYDNVAEDVIALPAEEEGEEPLRFIDVLVQLVNYLLAII